MVHAVEWLAAFRVRCFVLPVNMHLSAQPYYVIGQDLFITAVVG